MVQLRCADVPMYKPFVATNVQSSFHAFAEPPYVKSKPHSVKHNPQLNSSQYRHEINNIFPQVVPILGPMASEQICILSHVHTRCSNGRFLPFLVEMVTDTDRLPSTLVTMSLINDSGIVMLVREVQPSKARSPMKFTDSPRVMLAREAQPSKALSSILVTDSPNVMLAREVQPAKALFPMLVTDSPKVMLAREAQFLKARPLMKVTDSPKMMLAKEAQPSKARSSIVFTDSPKVMLAREAQPSKALPPM